MHPVQGARGEDRPLIGMLAGSSRVGLAVLAVVVGADQLLKFLIAATYPLGGSTPVLDGIVSLTYVRNPGVAFGLLPQVSIIVPAAIALTLLVVLFYNGARWARTPRVQLALTLLAGGAVGNLIDRLRLGAVIDYIDVHFWPVFNIADVAVTAGAALLTASLFLRHDATGASLR